MKYATITYYYKGVKHQVLEAEQSGWEDLYDKQIINRIKSLTDAGATITNIRLYEE